MTNKKTAEQNNVSKMGPGAGTKVETKVGNKAGKEVGTGEGMKLGSLPDPRGEADPIKERRILHLEVNPFAQSEIAKDKEE